MRMGPLNGVKIVEFAGIGPGPFAAMMLADMGAELLRIDRPASATDGRFSLYSLDLLNRNRMSAGIDLKHPEGTRAALRLIERADALIDGFRPGVMDRLGLGPEVCLAKNPRLVYGWKGTLKSARFEGQSGIAGHDGQLAIMQTSAACAAAQGKLRAEAGSRHPARERQFRSKAPLHVQLLHPAITCWPQGPVMRLVPSVMSQGGLAHTRQSFWTWAATPHCSIGVALSANVFT